ICSDATLRELARVRPSTLEAMRLVYGIGDAKLREYGNAVLGKIRLHCQEKGLAMDQASRPPKQPEQPVRVAPLTGSRAAAFDLFRSGAAVEDVMHQTNRTRSTVMDYLAEFIRQERVDDISTWVSQELYDQVTAAARQVGTE